MDDSQAFLCVWIEEIDGCTCEVRAKHKTLSMVSCVWVNFGLKIGVNSVSIPSMLVWMKLHPFPC